MLFTKHETRNTKHETRNTKHEIRNTAFFAVAAQGTHDRNPRPDRRALRPDAAFLRVVARHGAAWAAAVARTGKTACKVFTKHGFYG